MKSIASTYILDELHSCHENIVKTMVDVNNDIASFMPPGKANPIAGVYAHLVLGEDMFMQGFLKKVKPLSETTWKDKTGISSPHPTEWQTEYPKWLKEVKIDTLKIQDFTKAVFASSEEYVVKLTDEDLNKNVDMKAFGMGELTVGYILGNMIVGHANNILGEISVLKGIQGLKGYPF